MLHCFLGTFPAYTGIIILGCDPVSTVHSIYGNLGRLVAYYVVVIRAKLAGHGGETFLPLKCAVSISNPRTVPVVPSLMMHLTGGREVRKHVP